MTTPRMDPNTLYEEAPVEGAAMAWVAQDMYQDASYTDEAVTAAALVSIALSLSNIDRHLRGVLPEEGEEWR